MKMVRWIWGLVLLGALVAVIQLADPLKDSPAASFQRLPEADLRRLAEAEWVATQPSAAVLLLDYVIENERPDKAAASVWRQKYVTQLSADTTPLGRLRTAGLTTAGAGNSFESLAGNTVADSALYGEIAEGVRQGALVNNQDEFSATLDKINPITTVFPPAEGAITLAKVARRTGAINDPLTQQLRKMLTSMQPDPKAALSVEKFKDNFMPLLELSRRCRTWGEFQVILQQADSSDQVKVLVKMTSATPAAAHHLAQILTVATREGRPAAAVCLDHILRQGPKGMDSLYAAIGKGAAGLKFVADHPGLTPVSLRSGEKPSGSLFDRVQDRYQSLGRRYGAGFLALKYLLIAVLSGLLVLVAVPGRYLEKLLTSGPANAFTTSGPGPIHYLLSALAVGAVLSGLAYLLSLAVRPAIEPATAGSVAAELGAMGGITRADSAFLSGTVVLVSLAIHAVVWFFVRGKIRVVEDDEAAGPAMRLKRLENLDVFLDLPLFTGLALTVVAFILITLDAGMSRHFAYTSTVVGILSSVSLRIRYLYPLKERLIQSR